MSEALVPNVLISIPTRENIHADTVGWCLRALKNSTSIGNKIGLQVVYSPYPIEMQRNNQVKNFLEDPKYTHLFLLDSDCVPPEGCIEKLLDYDLDIVASVAPAIIGDSHVLTAATRIPPELADPDRPTAKFNFPSVKDEKYFGLQEVDGVGMTGVLIKRHVFDKIEQPYFKMLYEDGGTSIDLGEDFYFCKIAQEAGFKIWADFSMRQKHYKLIPL